MMDAPAGVESLDLGQRSNISVDNLRLSSPLAILRQILDGDGDGDGHFTDEAEEYMPRKCGKLDASRTGSAERTFSSSGLGNNGRFTRCHYHRCPHEWNQSNHDVTTSVSLRSFTARFFRPASLLFTCTQFLSGPTQNQGAEVNQADASVAVLSSPKAPSSSTNLISSKSSMHLDYCELCQTNGEVDYSLH